MSQIIHGDCLTELKNIASESIDLIYVDPPFFTQKKQKLISRKTGQIYSFNDTWKNIEEYISFIKDRILECHRVLKDTGSLFFHCDRKASHHIRIILDDIFGTDNFHSDIVWTYRRWSNSKKGLLHCHQNILFYSKSKNYKFNTLYEDYSATTNIDQIFQLRVRDENGKTIYKQNDHGEYELNPSKKGVPLSDVWYIPYLNPKAKERTGFPTQKPVLLLERIIQLVTDEGDIVLDPFCGSGTTLVAAKLCNRKYIGIDILKEAVGLSRQRIENPIKTDSNLIRNGISSYVNQTSEILELLEKIGAIPVQRNKGIDGFIKINNIIKPIPVRIQRKNETIESCIETLINACSKNKYQFKILIKTNSLSKPSIYPITDNLLKYNIALIENINDFINNKKKYINLTL